MFFVVIAILVLSLLYFRILAFFVIQLRLIESHTALEQMNKSKKERSNKEKEKRIGNIENVKVLVFL